jgi:hypothetical protein
MATSELYSITVGDVELQSGYGNPDHSAPSGSLYSNIDIGSLWINYGGTNWQSLITPAYGSMYFNELADELTITSTNVWTDNPTVTWLEGHCNDFSVSGSRWLVYEPTNNRSGSFLCEFGMSCEYETSEYHDLGISINGNDPETGHWNRFCTNASFLDPFVGHTFIVKLGPNDYLEMLGRVLIGTGDHDWNHGWVTIKKIADE